MPDRHPSARRPHRLPVRRQPRVLLQPGLHDPRARSGLDKKYRLRQRASRPAPSGTTTTPSASRGSTSTPAWPASTSCATTIDTGLLGNPLDLPAFPTRRPSPSRTACSKTTGSSSTRRSRATRSTRTSSPAKARSAADHLPWRRAHGAGRVLRRPHGGQRQDLAEDGRGAAQLPAAPAERLRQPLPGDAVLRGARRRDGLRQRRPDRSASRSSAATRAWPPARRQSTRC